MNLHVVHEGVTKISPYADVDAPVVVDGALYIRSNGQLVSLYAAGKWIEVMVVPQNS